MGWTVGRAERDEKAREAEGAEGRDGRGGQVTGEDEQRAHMQVAGWLSDVTDEIERVEVEVEVEARGATDEARREMSESI